MSWNASWTAQNHFDFNGKALNCRYFTYTSFTLYSGLAIRSESDLLLAVGHLADHHLVQSPLHWVSAAAYCLFLSSACYYVAG